MCEHTCVFQINVLHASWEVWEDTSLHCRGKSILEENLYVFFVYSMTQRWRGVRMLANLVSRWRKRSALVIISVLVSDRGQHVAWLDVLHSNVRKFSEPQKLCESLQEMSSCLVYSPKILAFIFHTDKQNVHFHCCTVDIQPSHPVSSRPFLWRWGEGSSPASILSNLLLILLLLWNKNG